MCSVFGSRSLHALEIAVDKISVITTALNQHGLDKLTVSLYDFTVLDMWCHWSTSLSLQRARLEGELHEAVSMTMSDALRSLLEHGWVGSGGGSSLASCFPPPIWWQAEPPKWRSLVSSTSGKECISWLLLRHYYRLKVSQPLSQLLLTQTLKGYVSLLLNRRGRLSVRSPR